MKCPVCGTVYRPTKTSKGEEEHGVISISPLSLTCRRCKADLSDLISLHDEAMWYHGQALHLLLQGRYLEAGVHNHRAIALYYSNANFHALAGKLAALQGKFREAISEWELALKFDPENTIACNCLQMVELMGKK
jgi:tetratricopeptide (TPR) repeat protein